MGCWQGEGLGVAKDGWNSTDNSNIPADPILRRVENVEGINAGLMPTRYVYRANIKPREVKRNRQFARAGLVSD